jgi:hypothetical protein
MSEFLKSWFPFHEAILGRSVKWLALSTHRLAFAGLHHRAADKARRVERGAVKNPARIIEFT